MGRHARAARLLERAAKRSRACRPAHILWHSPPDASIAEQSNDAVKLREVLEKETKLELSRKRKKSVREEDLLSPGKKVAALATLYSSLVRPPFLPALHSIMRSLYLNAPQDWFIVHVSSLRATGEAAASPPSNGFAGPRRPRESGYSFASSSDSPSLPSRELDEESASAGVGEADAEAGAEGFTLPLTSEMARCVGAFACQGLTVSRSG